MQQYVQPNERGALVQGQETAGEEKRRSSSSQAHGRARALCLLHSLCAFVLFEALLLIYVSRTVFLDHPMTWLLAGLIR